MTVADLWLPSRRRCDGGRRGAERRPRPTGVGADGASATARRPRRRASAGAPVAASRLDRRDRLRRRGVHARRGRHPPAVLHQPRRPGLRPGQPARGGQGRAVRPLLAARPRACAGCSSTSSSATSTSPATQTIDATVGLRRAEELYDRVFFEYGDDSVAQLGGVHLACEQASNLLTKVLEWGRLMAYLEQSHPLHRLRRPHRRPLPLLPRPRACSARRSAPATSATWTACSTPTPSCCRRCTDFFREPVPQGPGRLRLRLPPGHPGQGVRRRCGASCRPRRCRTSASTAPARATSSCCCACGSHPLPEARAYADLMLHELRKVIPSFLKRVDLADRGVAWSDYLGRTRDGHGRASPSGSSRRRRRPSRPRGHARRLRPRRRGQAGRGDALPAHAPARGARSSERVRAMSADERLAVVRAYVGDRDEPPPQAGPGARAHRLPLRRAGRLRRLPRPPAPPHAHHRVAAAHARATATPGPRRSTLAGAGRRVRRGHGALGRALRRAAEPVPGPGAVRRVAWPTRCASSMQINAREAMHLLELRTGAAGPPRLPRGRARRCTASSPSRPATAPSPR